MANLRVVPLPPNPEYSANLQSAVNRLYESTRSSGGGGGDSMEERVRRLETDMLELKADMKAVRSDLSEIKGKVSMLPGYPGIALIMGLLVALVTLAQKLLPLAP